METVSAACLVVLTFLCHVVSGGDKDVWCGLNKSCLLEANFPVGDDVVIHWLKVTSKDINVHSYYYDKDQLQLQDQHFKGRTSMFKENIGKGNSSLLLKEVLVADEGRYKCYVGTITDKRTSFLNLHVEAPVTKIHIQEADNKLVCSSSGLYPEPQLTWSTKPPLPHALRNTTHTFWDEGTQLYNISNLLDLPGDDTRQVDYICDVRSHSSRRLTWRNISNISVSEGETTIDCLFLTHKTNLVWTFNQSQTIVNRSSSVSEDWKMQVKNVSAQGRLALHHLSSDHDGTYTCKVTNATETSVTTFFLRMTDGPSQGRMHIVIGVVATLAVLAILAYCVFCKNKTGQGTSNVI